MSCKQGASNEDDFDVGEANLDVQSSDNEPLAKKCPEKSFQKKTSKKVKKGKMSKNKKFSNIVPATTKYYEDEYEVEAIVGHREFNGKLVYKIRWKNYEPIHDTWESYESLSCPGILEIYNIKHKLNIPKAIQNMKDASNCKPSSSKKHRCSVSEVDFESGSVDSIEEYEVEKLVEMRMKRDGSREFLVRWKHWSSLYDTWEPEFNLQNSMDLIDIFLKRVEVAKNLNSKELRTVRKRTNRFTLATCDTGRRLSKRRSGKQRVNYYDGNND